MNTDNRLLTRESSEHIREFFSTVERLSVSMGVSLPAESPAMAGEQNSIRTANWLKKLKVSRRSLQQCRDTAVCCLHRLGGKIVPFFRHQLLDGLLPGGENQAEEL